MFRIILSTVFYFIAVEVYYALKNIKLRIFLFLLFILFNFSYLQIFKLLFSNFIPAQINLFYQVVLHISHRMYLIFLQTI